MEIIALLLGMLLGFIGAVLFLQPAAITKLFASMGKASTKRDVAPKPRTNKKTELDKNYSPSHIFAEISEEAVKNVLNALTEDASEWEQTSMNDGIPYFKKEIEGMSVPLVRGDAVINAPPSGLLQLLLDFDNAITLDPQVKRQMTLEKLDNQSDVVYSEFHGIFPVAGRDFCVVRTVREVAEGLLIASSSIDHAKALEIQEKGIVRATCHFTGWLLRPVDGGSKTSVTYASSVDLKGSIPKPIVRKVTQSAPAVVLQLKKLATRCIFDDNADTDAMQDQLLELGRASLERVLLDVEQEGWEEVMTKNDVRIFKKRGAQHKFKGEGIIPFPPEEVRRVLMNTNLATQYDDLCQEASVVTTLDDNTKVIYLRYQAKRCLLKAARDFCLVHSQTVLNDGIYISAGASITHPKCPTCPNTVRAETQCSGWVVQPIDGGRHSRVTHLAQVDLHGGVPDRLLEYISKRVPLSIYYLGRYLQKTVAKPAEHTLATRRLTNESCAVSETSASTHDFNAKAEEAFNSVLASTREAASEWEQFNVKNNVTYLKKEVVGMSVPLIRGEAVIKATPKDLLNVLLNPGFAAKLDPQIKQQRILETMNGQCEVLYTEFKGIFPAAGRDFCVIRTHRQIEDGFVVASSSIDYTGANAVQAKGVVRATCHFTGWLLRPVGDGSTTSVVYVASVDLNGLLPKAIIRIVTQDGPTIVMRLKQSVS